MLKDIFSYYAVCMLVVFKITCLIVASCLFVEKVEKLRPKIDQVVKKIADKIFGI